MISKELRENLKNTDLNQIKDILDECIDILNIVDIENCQKALGVNRSRVYQIMNDNNTLKIGKHKFPMLRIILDNNLHN